MSAVASDAACVEFAQHAWRPELCVNCQRPRNEHGSLTKATSASARIVGGGQSKRHESVIGAKEASPSPVPNKRASTLPRQSKTTPRKPTDKPSDNGTTKSTQQKQGGVKPTTDWRKSKTPSSDQSGELNRSSRSEQNSEIKSQSNQGVGDSKSNRSQPEQEDGEFRKDRPPEQERGDKNHSEEIGKNNEPPKGILSRKSSDSRKKSEEKPNSRVAFIDTNPHIIGYDGGVGSVFAEDDNKANANNDDPFSSSTNSSEGSFSLTDEEKSFALLSLENTVWNSDADNLLRDKGSNSGGAHRHSSREFEDLSLDALCFSARHFQNLKDCDATTRHFGTFPLRKRSSSTKLSLDSVFSDGVGGGRAPADPDSSRLGGGGVDLDPVKDTESSGPESYKRPRSSSSASGDGRMRPAMTESSSSSSTPAYKVVSIVEGSGGSGSRDSFTVTDFNDASSSSSHGRRQDSDNVSENSGNSSGGGGRGHTSSSESGSSPTRVKVR